MATDTKLSKTVPYQDDWGNEHKARRSSDYPEIITAISFDQLPFFAEVIRALPEREWQVFNLHFIRKIESTSEISEILGFKQTSDVRTYIKRINAKMKRLNSNLEYIKVHIPEPEDDDDGRKIAVLLSRHQLSQPHSVTKENQPVCRASAPSCRNRKDGMK